MVKGDIVFEILSDLIQAVDLPDHLADESHTRWLDTGPSSKSMAGD